MLSDLPGSGASKVTNSCWLLREALANTLALERGVESMLPDVDGLLSDLCWPCRLQRWGRRLVHCSGYTPNVGGVSGGGVVRGARSVASGALCPGRPVSMANPCVPHNSASFYPGRPVCMVSPCVPHDMLAAEAHVASPFRRLAAPSAGCGAALPVCSIGACGRVPQTPSARGRRAEASLVSSGPRTEHFPRVFFLYARVAPVQNQCRTSRAAA